MGAYGQSKMANIQTALYFNEQWKAQQVNIRAWSLHPGVIHTDLARDMRGGAAFYFFTKPFQKSVPQGAATQLHCAVDDEALQNTGRYYDNAKVATCLHYGRDTEAAKELVEGTFALIDEAM